MDPDQKGDEGTSYKDVMRNKYLDEEEKEVYKQIAEKQKEENDEDRKVQLLSIIDL